VSKQLNGGSVRVTGRVRSIRGGGRRIRTTTFLATAAAATRASIKNLIDSPLLLFSSKVFIPNHLFDLSLLFLEHVDRSARSRLGHFLGMLTRSKLPFVLVLKTALIGIMAVDETILFAMCRTESAILAFPILLGTLLWLIVGIASGRTILAFVLLGNLARFHRIGCLKVSFLL
jgi:hypothetical protein